MPYSAAARHHRGGLRSVAGQRDVASRHAGDTVRVRCGSGVSPGGGVQRSQGGSIIVAVTFRHG